MSPEPGRDAATAAALVYPPLARPTAGGGVEVAPGVHWLRLPLPFRLDHVNVWLLADRDGWTLVDSGLAHEATMDAWRALAATYFADRPLRRIVVTHHHGDHVGLAGWLAREHGATLSMSRAAHARAQALLAGGVPAEAASAFYRRYGVDDVARVLPMASGRLYARMVRELPEAVTHLADGDALAIGAHAFRVLELGGHAEGHVVLHDEARGIVIAGDQALPSISANVSLYPYAPDADPLAEFLAAMARLATLPGDPLVLPAHGRPYRGLAARCREVAAHHEATCARLVELCGAPRTAVELLPELYPRALDEVNFVLALGETLAHLRRLERAGRLVASSCEGRIRFAARAEEAAED